MSYREVIQGAHQTPVKKGQLGLRNRGGRQKENLSFGWMGGYLKKNEGSERRKGSLWVSALGTHFVIRM